MANEPKPISDPLQACIARIQEKRTGSIEQDAQSVATEIRQEIAARTGIPEANLRRWRRMFSGWLPSKTFGRAERFRPESIATLERIAGMFSERKRREEIEAALRAESGPVIDVSREDDREYAPRLKSAENAILERIATALESLATSQVAIAVELARRVERLEAVRSLPQVSPESPRKKPRNPQERVAIINQVMRLHQEGLGARAIATAMQKEGYSTLSGRGEWGSGVVRRIIKRNL